MLCFGLDGTVALLTHTKEETSAFILIREQYNGYNEWHGEGERGRDLTVVNVGDQDITNTREHMASPTGILTIQ